MHIVSSTLLLLSAAAVAWADPSPQDEDPPPALSRRITTEPEEPQEREGVLVKAADLRSRVRTMRKSLLGGGPAVEKAEKEAVAFYRRKIRENARRVDELRTTRDAKDAEYQVALDATLRAEDEESRTRAARDAASLRSEIIATVLEVDDLSRRRKALGNAVAAIQARIERRQRILEHFDDDEMPEAFPFLGESALGPDADTASGPDPFTDDAFIADLIRRDPARARAIVLARDPSRYWKLFPLTPPHEALRAALAFPPPDMPGGR